jgi:hypothetical protein
MSVTTNWNMRCPKCGRDDKIDIAASVWIRLVSEGTDADQSHDGSHEWDDGSAAKCAACDYADKVATFRI